LLINSYAYLKDIMYISYPINKISKCGTTQQVIKVIKDSILPIHLTRLIKGKGRDNGEPTPRDKDNGEPILTRDLTKEEINGEVTPTKEETSGETIPIKGVINGEISLLIQIKVSIKVEIFLPILIKVSIKVLTKEVINGETIKVSMAAIRVLNGGTME
jgi:hypothetical protein